MLTTHRLINWGLASVIALLLGSVYRLDGPSDHQAQVDQLADLEAAVKLDNAKERLTKAIAALCGQNASAILLDDTTVQCVTKRGHKTQRVAL